MRTKHFKAVGNALERFVMPEPYALGERANWGQDADVGGWEK